MMFSSLGVLNAFLTYNIFNIWWIYEGWIYWEFSTYDGFMKNRFIGKLPCCKWASLIAQLVKNLPACRRPRSDSWVRKICWGRDRLPIPVFLGFPCGSAGKESACNVGDLGSIPGLRRSPGEGKGYPLHYSGLENSMDYTVHGFTKSQTRLSDFHLPCPKKRMICVYTHSHM